MCESQNIVLGCNAVILFAFKCDGRQNALDCLVKTSQVSKNSQSDGRTCHVLRDQTGFQSRLACVAIRKGPMHDRIPKCLLIKRAEGVNRKFSRNSEQGGLVNAGVHQMDIGGR